MNHHHCDAVGMMECGREKYIGMPLVEKKNI